MSAQRTASEAVSAEQIERPVTAKMLSAVCDVGHRHFGERPRRIRRRSGGRTNTVLDFLVSQGRFVFRMHEDPAKVHDYLKEQWAMDAARAAGMPTPRVLEVASLADGRPYMIMERIDGVEARHVTDRMAPLRELGGLAARLHTVRTRGFGPVFDWSHNSLSRHTSWADYLTDGFGAEARLAELQKYRMLTPAQARALQASLCMVARWRKPPVLQHGDLRLKNLIVAPESGRIRALIDWENCLSSPPPPTTGTCRLPCTSLASTRRRLFLEGYGMTPTRFAELVPFLRLLNVLNYSHAVQSAAANKHRERLAWRGKAAVRLRLAGSLELYER